METRVFRSNSDIPNRIEDGFSEILIAFLKNVFTDYPEIHPDWVKCEFNNELEVFSICMYSTLEKITLNNSFFPNFLKYFEKILNTKAIEANLYSFTNAVSTNLTLPYIRGNCLLVCLQEEFKLTFTNSRLFPKPRIITLRFGDGVYLNEETLNNTKINLQTSNGVIAAINLGKMFAFKNDYQTIMLNLNPFGLLPFRVYCDKNCDILQNCTIEYDKNLFNLSDTAILNTNLLAPPSIRINLS